VQFANSISSPYQRVAKQFCSNKESNKILMTWESLRMKKIIFHRLIRKVITPLVEKVIMGAQMGNSSQYIQPGKARGGKIIHFRFRTGSDFECFAGNLVSQLSHTSSTDVFLKSKSRHARDCCRFLLNYRALSPAARITCRGALKKLNLTPLSSR
jgi:hypothetical protein